MANNLKHKPSSQSYIKLIPHPCYCGTTIKQWNVFIKPSLSAFKLLPGLIRCSKPFMVERTPHKNLSLHPFQLISQSLKLEKKNKATKFQYPRSLIKGHIRPLFLTKEISQHPMTPLLILLCFRPEIYGNCSYLSLEFLSSILDQVVVSLVQTHLLCTSVLVLDIWSSLVWYTQWCIEHISLHPLGVM